MKLSRSIWKITLAACIAAPFAQANAQANPVAIVRGTVTDSSTNTPVVGAQVLAVGTTRGALTDTAGAYTLRVPPGTITIRVQRIGYAPSQRTATATLDGTATADFSLRAVSAVLSEVVVTGYGTQDRSQVTGATTNVRGEEVQNQQVAGLDAALQGKAAGVQVTQNSGEPGTGISVRIRGAASLGASNQPLYVVDGVPLDNDSQTQLFPAGGEGTTPLTTIDPNEIESITVLKDAASAAIYGSRAANGVVMITTKRGAAGRARLSINANTGFQNAATRLKLMNSTQYVTYMNEGAANDGDDAPYDVTDANINTDWQSAIFRTAPISNINLGLSGGSETLRYLIDGSFFAQQGIVIGNDYKRSNMRVNVDYDPTTKLGIKTSVALSRENNDRIEGNNSDNGIVTNAIGNPSVYPIRNADGTFFSPDNELNDSQENTLYLTNPVAIAQYDRLPTITDHVLASVEGNYQFTSKFSLTGRGGIDVLHDNETQWQSPLVIGTYASGANGVAKSAFDDRNKYLLETFATYKAGSSEGSSVNVVGGASVEYNHEDDAYLRGEGFPSPAFQYVGSATNIVDFSGLPADHNLESYFARANYSYKDRYLLQGSIRADGSSRFGENNRWGYFPAVSAGWVLTNESFMKDFGQRFGALKLRGSFGETGNQSIPNYASLGTYTSGNYGTTPGIVPYAFANPNLKWESTKEWDGGIDFAPFGGRLTVIADYYHKLTSDLLVNQPVPCTVFATAGSCSYYTNIGDVLNKGFEFGLNSDNFRGKTSKDFSWSTDFNISFNHNEVTALYSGQPVFGDNYRAISRAAVGQPLGEFYVQHFKGVDPATGDAMYTDSLQNAGNPQPKWWGGLGNTVSWKNLSLRGFLEFSHGARVFNLMRIFADDGGYHYDNKFTYALNRWQQPGDITNEPRASFDGTSDANIVSDRFIEDGSYLRIQEITLSWKLPVSLWRGMSNAKVYVSGHNLHTFTKYTGYDPDVNSNGTSNIDLGTDYYSYPRARTFTLGVTGDF
jgi:TonB-linked SusC/RagA family outer membrane protein